MNFTCRQSKENGVQRNTSLGDEYEVIHITLCEEQFKKHYKATFNEEYKEDSKCYAFVYGDKVGIALYKGDRNYIMTENGKTFAHISC